VTTGLRRCGGNVCEAVAAALAVALAAALAVATVVAKAVEMAGEMAGEMAVARLTRHPPSRRYSLSTEGLKTLPFSRS